MSKLTNGIFNLYSYLSSENTMDKFNNDATKDFIKFIQRFDISGFDILDIGCADLRPYSMYLISYSTSYCGIDINLHNVEVSKSKTYNLENVRILNMKSENLEFEDSSFDLVVCNNTLAYTNKIHTMNEIFRVLKEGGVCLSFFNNTIDYSYYKMFHKIDQNRSQILQIMHSIIVIFNTFSYKIFHKRRFFHTTYNTVKEIDELLSIIDLREKRVWVDRSSFPYDIINFFFKK